MKNNFLIRYVAEIEFKSIESNKDGFEGPCNFHEFALSLIYNSLVKDYKMRSLFPVFIRFDIANKDELGIF